MRLDLSQRLFGEGCNTKRAAHIAIHPTSWKEALPPRASVNKGRRAGSVQSFAPIMGKRRYPAKRRW
jgi:hypothetical protein